jgi:hypothetical protein
MLGRKQLAFRLEEEKFLQFQRYAEFKNKTMQDLLENFVDQILNGGRLSPQLRKVLEDALENRVVEIKQALKKGLKRALYLGRQGDYVVQIIIDEYGVIHELENEKGWIPYNVREERAYLLWEFESQDIVFLAFNEMVIDSHDLLVLFDEGFNEYPKLSYDSFAKWLTRTGKASWAEDYEYDAEFIVREGAAKDCPALIYMIFDWSPKAFGLVKLYLIDLAEKGPFGDSPSLIDERIEEAWDAIVKRDELQLT